MANGASTKVWINDIVDEVKKYADKFCVLVDYILFIKANVDLDINKNEVQDYKYVDAEQLKTMFEDKALKFTPWFKLICTSMLFEWWKHLDSGLEKYMNEQHIRRML